MLTVVAASSNNGVIGRDNGLPWRLPVDLKHFKKTTIGKPVLMGRRTLASIGDKPLPGRENIVLSRSSAPVAGTHVVATIDEGIAFARQFNDELMILGGGEIYALTVPRADKIVLTVVLTNVVGDAHFPPLPSGFVEDVAATWTDLRVQPRLMLLAGMCGIPLSGSAPFSWPSAAFDARFAALM